MMHDRYERIRVLTHVFGIVRQSNDGINIACRCPNCYKNIAISKTQKLKLAVRLDTGIYHCWVCGIRGRSITNLIKRLSHDNTDAIKLWPINNSVKYDVVHHEKENVELPIGFQLLATVDNTDHRFKQTYNYLLSRGISTDDMWRWRIGVSDDEQFVNRVIIPSFDSAGNLNYYTSRSIDNNTYPRYINASSKKHNIIFNELDISWSDELLLTEGVFDLMTANNNATCLLGKSLTEHFLLFNTIVKNDTPIVLALDSAEYEQTNKIAKLLYGYNIDVKIMSLDGYSDLGVMPKQVCDVRRNNATRWTPKSELMRKIINIDPMRSTKFTQAYL